MTNVIGIIKQYLQDNGYDGLFNGRDIRDPYYCACLIQADWGEEKIRGVDNELLQCSNEECRQCQPGYRKNIYISERSIDNLMLPPRFWVINAIKPKRPYCARTFKNLPKKRYIQWKLDDEEYALPFINMGETR